MYKIVEARYKTDLEQKVSTLLSEGWVLHGRLIIDNAGYFVQAMYKPKKKEK